MPISSSDQSARAAQRLARADNPRNGHSAAAPALSLAARDAERQRIEQDIRDGVQQRLTAPRIRLALAAERFEARGDVEVSAALKGFGQDVDAVSHRRD